MNHNSKKLFFTDKVAVAFTIMQMVFLLFAPVISTAQTPADSASSTATSTAGQTTIIPYLQLISPPSYIGQNANIFVGINTVTDFIRLEISGPKHAALSGIYYLQEASQTKYRFWWDITSFPSGTYQIRAVAQKNGIYYYSTIFNTHVVNSISTNSTSGTTSTTTASSATTTTTTTQSTFGSATTTASTNATNASTSSTSTTATSTSTTQSTVGSATTTASTNATNASTTTATSTSQTTNRNLTSAISTQSMVTPSATSTKANDLLKAYLDSRAALDLLENQEIDNDNPIAPASSTHDNISEDNDQPAVQAESPTVKEIIVDPACLKNNITDQAQCALFIERERKQAMQSALTNKTNFTECSQNGISNSDNCDIFVRENLISTECRQAGLQTKEDCEEYMTGKYGQPQKCEDLSVAECKRLITEVILSNFVAESTIIEAKKEAEMVRDLHIQINRSNYNASSTAIVKNDLGQSINAESANGFKNFEKLLPFAQSEKEIKVMVLGAQANQAKNDIVPVVLLIDSDNDGLPDDMEERIGTDKNNPDTDGDGYADGLEVKTGYNPLGQGKDQKIALKPVEGAIMEKKSLEQPKLVAKEKINQQINIKNVQNSPARIAGQASKNLTITGKGRPNDVVTIYIYSFMPIVMTVKTDANGNFVYELDKALVDGKHEAYVVINDNEGKIVEKSSPFSFFINQAQAVNQEDYLRADINVADNASSMIIWYAIAGLALIMFVLGLYFLNIKVKQKLNY